jgi:hypothetical protein
VNGVINWDEETVKDIHLATLTMGFLNLLNQTATVQETQFANLLNTIFRAQPDVDNNKLADPLERLMSLSIFPKKFTKTHLNVSFQCTNLEANMMYKSPSINPFHYAPQNCHALVKATLAKIEEEQNKFNWKVNENDKIQISSVIEGVQCVESMDDISRTCANMCRVMLAIVDVLKTKPLLYQVMYKFIKITKNKKAQTWMRDNSKSIAHLAFVFMAKLHQFFQNIASFSQNSININKVEINNQNFNVKQVATTVKLMTKFIKKMTEHIEDISVPKEIPPFARTFFFEQNSRKITLAATTEQKTDVKQPSATTKGG